jgi:hypothetical protein
MPTPEEAAAAAAAAAAAGNKPWYDGKLDQEHIGHLQMRGLHDKSVEEVALNLTKAHREAQVKLSTDPALLLRLPKAPDDAEGWKGVYTKLGVPADAKEYDFSALKNAKGEALDEDTVKFYRDQAVALHLTKQGAVDMAAADLKRAKEISDREAGEFAAKLTEEKKKLADNWKANFDGNMFVAKQGALKLGLTPEMVAGLEKVAGYSGIMEAMRQVGVLAGEHKFVQDPNKPAGGVMTKEEAIAKKAELMSNAVWTAKYTGGDKACLREMLALNTIISGAG